MTKEPKLVDDSHFKKTESPNQKVKLKGGLFNLIIFIVFAILFMLFLLSCKNGTFKSLVSDIQPYSLEYSTLKPSKFN